MNVDHRYLFETGACPCCGHDAVTRLTVRCPQCKTLLLRVSIFDRDPQIQTFGAFGVFYLVLIGACVLLSPWVTILGAALAIPFTLRTIGRLPMLQEARPLSAVEWIYVILDPMGRLFLVGFELALVGCLLWYSFVSLFESDNVLLWMFWSVASVWFLAILRNSVERGARTLFWPVLLQEDWKPSPERIFKMLAEKRWG